MSLLKVAKYDCLTNEPPEISLYKAWLELVDDPDCRKAVVAANINTIRREAPFAYFFASGSPVDACEDDDLIMNLPYLSSLDRRQLHRGIWLYYAEDDRPTSTAVTAIGYRDILPFVRQLDEEEFALLCLPSQLSLEEIDARVRTAMSNREAILALLRDGGCIITVIDDVNFKVQTLDRRYATYFE